MMQDLFVWALLIIFVSVIVVVGGLFFHYMIEIGKWNGGYCKKCGEAWMYDGKGEDGRLHYIDYNRHEIKLNPDAFPNGKPK